MFTTILETREEVELIAADLLNDAARNGFVIYDSEFNADGRVAVVQIMSSRHQIYIFRTSLMGEIPAVVKEILSDANIVKVGHSLESDELALRRYHGFGFGNKFDVRHLLMSLQVRIPSMGRRSNLKELMAALVPELRGVELGWWDKTDWDDDFTMEKIQYLKLDVLGVYMVCLRVMGANEFQDLKWSTFVTNVPNVEQLIDRRVHQEEWVIFNQ